MSQRPVSDERVIDKNIILNLEKSVNHNFNGSSWLVM